LKKLITFLIFFTMLFSFAGCKKKEPLDNIIDKCAISFAKAYLVNNFEYNPNIAFYISERLDGFHLQENEEIKFPYYYFIYDRVNVLFCVGVYCSENNDTGSITYPYMGKFVYSALVDETTTSILKEKNLYPSKALINKEISLTDIKNIDINENLLSQDTSLMIQELLVELSLKKIKNIAYTAEDKFYIKNPIKDYSIVIEDKKNISINEKLIYPLFMNDEIIGLYEFNHDGTISCIQIVGQDSIFTKAYQTSDKFILIHGGDYPYLKTYCLYGDEKLDAETICEMLTDPIFIKTKKEIDQLLKKLQPYELLLEIEVNEIEKN